jgi:hypothetical protein
MLQGQEKVAQQRVLQFDTGFPSISHHGIYAVSSDTVTDGTKYMKTTHRITGVLDWTSD